MFALKRNEAKTRGQLLREELNQTVEHARRAAGHAAGGVGAAVGPRVSAARETVAPRVRDTAARGWGSTVATFTPLSEAAQAKLGNGRARRKKAARTAQRRWPVLAGLLACGALVGAVAAAMLRRRQPEPEPPPQASDLAQPAEEAGKVAPTPPVSEPVSAINNRRP